MNAESMQGGRGGGGRVVGGLGGGGGDMGEGLGRSKSVTLLTLLHYQSV
jgi:hypothetical protein